MPPSPHRRVAATAGALSFVTIFSKSTPMSGLEPTSPPSWPSLVISPCHYVTLSLSMSSQIVYVLILHFSSVDFFLTSSASISFSFYLTILMCFLLLM